MDGVNVAKREKHWWEHYPLHKLWCNDYLPLVPRFWYRKADKYNASNFGCHWLILHLWTMTHVSLEFDVGIDFDKIGFGFCLPYLRIWIGIRQLWNFTYPLYRVFSRDPERRYDKEYDTD